MKKELPKAYEANKYEDNIYKLWEESGFFTPEVCQPWVDNPDGEDKREPYSIMMPPPNVTGVLHLGHALENSLMDVMTRYQRMQGKKVLLLPGTDHAAVATQARVEKNLVDGGMKNPREELGREGLLEKIREYAEESKSTILKQIKKMGTSADWSRLAYTFDEDRSKAVNEVFKKMYEDGLIYRGDRIVNWDPVGQTTVADDEIEYIEEKTSFYTFKYGPFEIGTSRPETKFGDKYVVMHPKDKRYKKYKHGQQIDLEWINGPISATIIKDEAIDMEFGTGVMTITPWHSMVDFEIAERHDLDKEQIIDKQGKLIEIAGDDFKGMQIEEARPKIVEKLKAKGLLVNIDENYIHNVSVSDRFKGKIEPQIMRQWFVDVNKEIPGKKKSLKQLMKDAVAKGHKGDKEQKVNITPDRFEKIYYSWIDNLRDWCISRQIWWGHQIPVWYKGSETKFSVDSPGEGWEQDPDTLDTWFSSGLWTFSTLGWPDNEKQVKNFHPTSWMQMGHEILFFWMARMILMSTYILDEIPFKDVYIHGILRDKDGKKFSKSAGNGVDPLEVIEKHGTDALRYSLISGISPGNDARFYLEKVEGSQHLVNKLWNMSRFMLMNIDEPKLNQEKPEAKTEADKWILNSVNTYIRSISDSLENYQFSAAGELLRSFTWDQIADWYLEATKKEGDKSEILNYILNTILKLWHPFIPFVTEQIWSEIYGKDRLLMVEKWPQYKKENYIFNNFDLIKNTITNIRSLRSDYNIDPVKKLNIVISAGKQKQMLEENVEVIKGLARLEDLKVEKSVKKPEGHVGFVIADVEVFVDLAGIVDFDKEKTRLETEIFEAGKYLVSLEKKLNNKSYVKNAPEAVVEKDKQKLQEIKEKKEKLEEQLNNLN